MKDSELQSWIAFFQVGCAARLSEIDCAILAKALKELKQKREESWLLMPKGIGRSLILEMKKDIEASKRKQAKTILDSIVNGKSKMWLGNSFEKNKKYKSVELIIVDEGGNKMKLGQILKCTKVGNHPKVLDDEFWEGKMLAVRNIPCGSGIGIETVRSTYWHDEGINWLVEHGYEFELIENGKVIETFGKKFNDPWVPEHENRFNTIYADGSVSSTRFLNYCSFDADRIKVGNCFETKEIAKHEAERESLMRRLRSFARANGGEGKWQIHYDADYEFEAIATNNGNILAIGAVTFASKKTCEEAIRRYGDEIKEFYKGGKE